MARKASIVFDLDGTLITCQERQMSVLRAILNKHEQSCDLDTAWRMKREGMSTANALNQIGLKTALINKIRIHWAAEIESPYWLSIDRCFNDSFVVLDSIKKQGYALFLLTGRSHPEWLMQQLKRLGLSKFFDAVFAVPHVNLIEQKTKVLRTVDPVLFVGDSEIDANAASCAQVNFSAVTTGQRSRQFLSNHGVDKIYSRLTEAVSSV